MAKTVVDKDLFSPPTTRQKKRLPIKVEDLPRIYNCSCCGLQLYDVTDEFYKSTNDYTQKANDYYVHICKGCLEDLYEEYNVLYQDERIAIMMICCLCNIYFSEEIYIKVKSNKSNLTIGDYIKAANLNIKKKRFGDTIAELLKADGAIFDPESSTDNIEKKALTDEEIEAKTTVIEIIGYDPWVNYPLPDRKYLFRELIKYFDDDISDDPYKLTVIMQIVEGNNQIRKINEQLSILKPNIDAEQIRSLNTVVKDIVSNIDKLAKENEISVKNRSNKEVGKNTLTFLMKKLRTLDFEKAEADYYDQLKSSGTQWALDMSVKAISENAYFNENDWIDIGNIRREIVDKLQKENDDLKEDKRFLSQKVQELELKLNELKDRNGDSYVE